MPKSALRLLLLSATLVFFGTPSLASAEGPPGFRPFAPDSIWNLPLRADAPLLPNSAAHVGWLRGQITNNGTWINTTTCGMPIHWAAPDTPRQTVTLASSSYQEKALMRAWQSVPIPDHARPANCSDKNFAVLQEQPDGTVTQWEFWATSQREDGSWIARWGGVTQDVMADRGVASKLAWQDWTAPTYAERTSATTWNVTATSVAMNAGVITIDDMMRGSIDHALAFAATDVAKVKWLWPAQRSDGTSVDPSALPEGARLRLDPSLDLEKIPMVPLVRMMAKAAQRYGIVVRDKTSAANVFYVEAPALGTTSPSTALLSGKYPDKALLAFPWDRLQVLDAQSCTTIGACTTTQRAAISVDTAAPRAGEPVALDTSNSSLEQARTLVEWDFDGDGTYEEPAAQDVKTTFTPGFAGPRQVGVRITTRDGSVVTGKQAMHVAPEPTPMTLRPTAVRPTNFYSYSSAYSSLAAITGTTAPPARPDRYRRLYTGSTIGTFEADLAAPPADGRSGATLNAWVDCTTTRCVQLSVVDSAGRVLGSFEPPFSSSGWVAYRINGKIEPGAGGELRLRGAVRNGASAAGQTSISAVSLTLDAR